MSVYPTPEFSSGDPLVCHSIQLRPSLWRVVFDALERLTKSYAWEQVNPTDAAISDVIDEIEKAIDDAIFAGCLMIGEVKYITTALPEWCLICDGTEYLKADYPELWGVIDAAYETDDDHFRVPDLIASFPLGSTTLGEAGGEAEHTLTVSEIPSHYHGSHIHVVPSVDVEPPVGEPDVSAGTPSDFPTASEGGGDPHNNMPPYETLLPVIVARYPSV